MKVCLINPPLISQENDPHTGIVFMPFMLAALSAYLKRAGHSVQVVDAFGLRPGHAESNGNNITQGIPISEAVETVRLETQVIIVHFGGVVAFRAVAALATELKRMRPSARLILMENAQAVTAAALRPIAGELLGLGYECLLCGDAEASVDYLLDSIENNRGLPEIAGIVFRRQDGSIYSADKQTFVGPIDSLPFPDWTAFPLANYWNLGYAHGPMEGPYLPLLTSRGCPVPCRFCVIPSTNDRKWRARSATSVAAEMEHWSKELDIHEFHIEDVNATVRNDRMVEIAREIVKRRLNVKWKFVSGTKIECIKLETIPLLAEAGCTYISFSPETGSERLLGLINKPFDYDLAHKMVVLMHRHGIYSQACFVLGFPGEAPDDVKATERYIKRLTRAGLDEIAQFIITPIPGSAIADEFSGYSDLTQLTFSPRWRSDYVALQKRRMIQYWKFILWKTCFHPQKLLRQFVNIFRGRFETKMEQAIYRVTLFRISTFRRVQHAPRPALGIKDAD